MSERSPSLLRRELSQAICRRCLAIIFLSHHIDGSKWLAPSSIDVLTAATLISAFLLVSFFCSSLEEMVGAFPQGK